MRIELTDRDLVLLVRALTVLRLRTASQGGGTAHIDALIRMLEGDEPETD